VIKVAFVAPSLNGGGAERAALTVLNALDDRSYARALYLFRQEGPYLRDVSASVKVVAAHGDRRIERIRQLAAFMGWWRPHIVVSFLSYVSVFAALRLARSRARFVISQQTPVSAFLADRDYRWRSPVRRRLFEMVVRRVYPRAAIIVSSRGVGEDLIERFGVPPNVIATIPNPVDLDAITHAASEPAELQRDDATPLIVSAGRLAEAKNWPLLIAALARLRTERPFRAVILGQGELEGDIRRRLAEAGLETAVRLCGFQANPWKYMARADVFVLTSRYEGFGNVLVEAMACGAPVVATASPGTCDIVSHEVNGLLVEQHDPAAVAAALARVLDDGRLRGQLREGGRTAALRYGVGTIAGSYDRFFQQLVA